MMGDRAAELSPKGHGEQSRGKHTQSGTGGVESGASLAGGGRLETFHRTEPQFPPLINGNNPSNLVRTA